MTIASRRTVTALALTAALSTAFLAGCGQAAETVAEQAAEQALGGGDSNVELDGENVTVTDDEGNEIAVGESVSLPDNWPSSVPTYDEGSLSFVSVDATGGATAMWQTDQPGKEAAAAYADALKGAGYTVESESAIEGMFGGEYLGNGMRVSVAAIESPDGNSLMVTATPE